MYTFWTEGIIFLKFLSIILNFVGSLLVLLVLIKYFKWKDEALGVMAFTSSILSSIVFAVANDGISFSAGSHIYFSLNCPYKRILAGALLNLFDGTSQIALRSLMFKLVQDHEIGKANSIFEISGSLTHLIFGSVYTVLYRNTVHVFPESIFWISSVLKIIGLFLFMWVERFWN